MKKALLLNLLIAALALLVGFGIGRKIYAPGENTAGTDNSMSGSAGASNNSDKIDYFPPLPGSAQTGAQGNANGVYTIEADDQRPGVIVRITKLDSATNVWVAVHEAQDSVPGNILGAARFRAGASELADIELLRPTAGGEQYIAMLHTDNGDDEFDFTKDVPLHGADGEIVMTIFRAVGSPAQR